MGTDVINIFTSKNRENMPLGSFNNMAGFLWPVGDWINGVPLYSRAVSKKETSF